MKAIIVVLALLIAVPAFGATYTKASDEKISISENVVVEISVAELKKQLELTEQNIAEYNKQLTTLEAYKQKLEVTLFECEKLGVVEAKPVVKVDNEVNPVIEPIIETKD
jgi:hypothetical protein